MSGWLLYDVVMKRKQAGIAEPTMYCRGCDYVLDGLSRPRCPECGRAFVPSDRRTFRRRPRGKLWVRLVKGLTVLVGVLVIATVLYGLWIYRFNISQRQTKAEIFTWGTARMSWESVCPEWLRSKLYRSGLPMPYKVKAVIFESGLITDDRLAVISEITTLKVLMGETEITDKGLRSIQNLRELEEIYFENSMITDAGLVYLLELKKLNSLDLKNSIITDKGFITLGKIPKLSSLSLDNTVVTGIGLSNLRNLDLILLSLENTELTDAGLKNLEYLTQLIWLDISGTKVTDAGLLNLEPLNKLRTLNISNTQITDAGLVYLQSLNELRTLDISGTQISNIGLQYLQKLPNLSHLDITGTTITNEGIMELKKSFPELKVSGLPEEPMKIPFRELFPDEGEKISVPENQ